MMATKNMSATSKTSARWLWILIGLGSISLIGLLWTLSVVGILALDFLAAIPLAMAGMGSALLLFRGIALLAKPAESVELTSGRPKMA
jgi:apolipoprotein N-acyltransferase